MRSKYELKLMEVED